MSVLHICCNLAGSTVFPQLFEALDAQGIEQIVFVPEKRAAELNKNEPRGVKTVRAMTVKQSDALFFFRKAQRSVPAIEKQIDLSGVTLIHAHTLFTDGSIAERLAKKRGLPYVVTLRYSDLSAIWKYEPHLRPMRGGFCAARRGWSVWAARRGRRCSAGFRARRGMRWMKSCMSFPTASIPHGWMANPELRRMRLCVWVLRGG